MITCEEFRRLNVSDSAFLRLSVAEKSASLKHFRRCRKCRRWLNRQPTDLGWSRTKMKRVARSLRRAAEQDPEWSPE